jgi:ABC-type tungstate transport system substrate-binding protein
MLELGLPIVIAVVSGLGAVTTRLHNRIYELDRRLDNTELRIAENYLSKAEFSAALERVEQHMIRIETKLDSLAR